MATQKKSTKGDGAKTERLWAAVRIGKRATWINHHTIRYTRKQAKAAYLKDFGNANVGEQRKNYGKTWTVRKVTISLA